eukprot:7349663-Prymnesium_polylepis.1
MDHAEREAQLVSLQTAITDAQEAHKQLLDELQERFRASEGRLRELRAELAEAEAIVEEVQRWWIQTQFLRAFASAEWGFNRAYRRLDRWQRKLSVSMSWGKAADEL